MQNKVYSEFEDFPFIVLWAHARELPLPDPRFYGPCGSVIIHEGRRICSGFLIRTDANFGVIGNIMSDPDVDPKIRDEALSFMMEVLLELARQCGVKLVCSSTNSERLVGRYEKHGFQRREKGITMMLREV